MATSTILTYNFKRKNIIDKKSNAIKKQFLKKKERWRKHMENEGSQQSSNDL